MAEERGIRRVVWLPNVLDEISEQVRKELGLNRSNFLRTCVLYYLEGHSLISTQLETVKKGIRNNAQKMEVIA